MHPLDRRKGQTPVVGWKPAPTKAAECWLPGRSPLQHGPSNRRRRTRGRLSFLRLGPLYERRTRPLGLGGRRKPLLLGRLRSRRSRLAAAAWGCSRALTNPNQIGVSQGLPQLVGGLRDHRVRPPDDAARNRVDSSCVVRGGRVFVPSLQRRAGPRGRVARKHSLGSAAESVGRRPRDDGRTFVGRFA